MPARFGVMANYMICSAVLKLDEPSETQMYRVFTVEIMDTVF